MDDFLTKAIRDSKIVYCRWVRIEYNDLTLEIYQYDERTGQTFVTSFGRESVPDMITAFEAFLNTEKLIDLGG